MTVQLLTRKSQLLTRSFSKRRRSFRKDNLSREQSETGDPHACPAYCAEVTISGQLKTLRTVNRSTFSFKQNVLTL